MIMLIDLSKETLNSIETVLNGSRYNRLINTEQAIANEKVTKWLDSTRPLYEEKEQAKREQEEYLRLKEKYDRGESINAIQDT